ncbi:hypothetical protein Avbf_16211 [Armadillidium vulgare]|nr:hypothetical protein Avbf_16211 [Armadillidium vulgare]
MPILQNWRWGKMSHSWGKLLLPESTSLLEHQSWLWQYHPAIHNSSCPLFLFIVTWHLIRFCTNFQLKLHYSGIGNNKIRLGTIVQNSREKCP